MYIHRRGPLDVFRPFSREAGPIVARDRCNLKSSSKVFSPRISPPRPLPLAPPFSLSSRLITSNGARSRLFPLILVLVYANMQTRSSNSRGGSTRESGIDSRDAQSRLLLYLSRERSSVDINYVSRLERVAPFSHFLSPPLSLPLFLLFLFCLIRRRASRRRPLPFPALRSTQLYIRNVIGNVETLSPCPPPLASRSSSPFLLLA